MTPSPDTGRRLAAVWFADIVGYTTLSAQDEDAAMRVVGAFQKLANEIVPQYSGRIVKFVGDAALAEFASTDGAIRSALMLVERFQGNEAAREYGTVIRVGVNVGEVISSADGDIYGDGVNLASRLQNSAEPGQVVASEAVQTQIRQRPVFRTEALGEKALKGIASPIRLFAVTLLEPGAEGAARIERQRNAAAPAVSPAAPAPPAPAPSRPPAKRAWIWAIPAVAAVLIGALAFYLLGSDGAMVLRAAYPVVEGGLDVGAPITVLFSGEVDPATATSQNVRLVDADGNVVAASVALGADRSSVVVDPRSALAFGSDYSLVLSEELRASGGEPVRGQNGEGFGATLALRTQPVPVGATRARVEPMPPQTADGVAAAGPVPVRFSEPIDPASVAEGIRLTTAAGEPVPSTLLFTDENREVRIEPAAALAAGGRYLVRVDSTVRGATGLPVVADSLAFSVARVAVASAGAAPAAPVRRSGAGTLNLTIAPSAAQPFVRVVVNGDTLSAGTLRGIALAEGRTHTVTLVGVPELSAHRLSVYEERFPVEPGQVLNVTAAVTPFGSIDVVSQPEGTVFVDGRQVGRTPLAGFPVTARVNHRLEIRPAAGDAGVGSYTAEFRVEPFEWKSLGRVTLPPPGRQ